MADEQTPAPDTAPNGAAQPAAQPAAAPRLEMRAQYIKDLSFETPGAPDGFLQPAQSQPQLKVNVGTKADKKADNTYEIVLTITANADLDGKALYVMELDYAGLITVQNAPETQHPAIVMIEGPRLLFPFAREIVATTTRNGGFVPLLLNPIDFVALYQQRLAERRAAQQETGRPGA